MNYYVLLIISYTDETKESQAIYPYASYDEAVSVFHKQFGGWMMKENVSHVLCMVIGKSGSVHKVETWDKEV